MAIIDGGKISETAWVKFATFLLVVIAALMGVIVNMGNKALDKLDVVGTAVIRHEVEIATIKQDIRDIKTIFNSGDRSLFFRGRGRVPHRDVPRPPHEKPVVPDQPKEALPPEKKDSKSTEEIIEIKRTAHKFRFGL